MNEIYLILPGCDDTNRGDQALIWETKRLAEEAGYRGEYYMLADEANSRQSISQGMKQMSFILPHPSTHFKRNDNIRYGKMLYLKWGWFSLWDAFKAVLLLFKPLRKSLGKLYSKETKRSLQLLEQCKAVFVKGGGFVHSYGSIANSYANFYDLYHIILAQKMGKDVYFMPNSFGPLRSPGTGRMVKKVLSRCRYVAARESISQEFLRSTLSFESDLTPDLAFYLPPESTLTAQQLERLQGVLSDRINVALTVRPYRFPGAADPAKKYQQYKESICEFIRFLDDNGYHAVLVEHTHSSNTHENDMSCIEDIQAMLGNQVSYSVYSDLSLNCRQLKYVYSTFDYLLGTRFHSVIFSLASKVPALAVSYGGNKGQGIMRDIGLEKYMLPIEDVSFDSLREHFLKMVNEKDEIQERIDSYLTALVEKRQQIVDRIAGR